MTETVDISNPDLFQDDAWERPFADLRDRDPVCFHPDSANGPFWSITRYDDVMTVELDHETYSSQQGIMIRDQPRGTMGRQNFLKMDPPDHTAHRKSIAPVFRPSNIEQLEPLLRRNARSVFEGLPKGEPFNWVERVSTELSTGMLAILMGAPLEDKHRLAEWSSIVTADLSSADAPVKTERQRYREICRMGDYFEDILQQRRQSEPGNDLLSIMAHDPAFQNLDQGAFIGTLSLLVVGGNETTRNTISEGLAATMDNPAELEKVRRDLSLVPSLVAETIRYGAPVIHMRRTATRDAALNGKTIRKGDKVVMWYISANRDPRFFDEPDRFKADRANARRQLGYGAGIHRCIGERLANLQLRVFWEEFLSMPWTPELAGTPRRTCSNFMHGFSDLPVRID